MARALDSWRVRILGVLLLVYLAITGVLAHYRLFWNDELFTVYIARIPSVSGIWAFLATGVEQTPPTFHLLTRPTLATPCPRRCSATPFASAFALPPAPFGRWPESRSSPGRTSSCRS